MRWSPPDVRALLLGLAATLSLPAPPARADLVTIDFETTPSRPPGPGTFVPGAPQDVVVVPDLATIFGGVVLSDPSFLAAFPAEGSAPNVYGTSFLNPNLGPAIVIDFSASALVTDVQGVLFNGLTERASYTVRAFAGSVQVAARIFADVPENFEPTGFVAFNISAAAITRVTITPGDASTFDYFIDDVGVTFSAVPEPGGFVLLGSGLAGVVILARRSAGKRGRTAP